MDVQYLSKLKVSPPGTSRPIRHAPLPQHMLPAYTQACARASHLPPDVAPIVVSHATSGTCDVCCAEDELDDNVRLLTCARCGVSVHNTCYDVSLPAPGALWLCEPCQTNVAGPMTCALCPVHGGAMRLAADGRWIHALCGLWIPGILLEPGKAPEISKVRGNSILRCCSEFDCCVHCTGCS
jgi:hypothetical protein